MAELQFDIGDKVKAAAESLGNMDYLTGRYKDWGTYTHEGKTGEYDADESDEEDDEEDEEWTKEFGDVECVHEHELTAEERAKNARKPYIPKPMKRPTTYVDESRFKSSYVTEDMIDTVPDITVVVDRNRA